MGSHAMRPNEQPNLLVFYGLPTLVDLWTDFDQGRQYMNEYYNGHIAPEAYGATQTQAQSIGNAGPPSKRTTGEYDFCDKRHCLNSNASFSFPQPVRFGPARISISSTWLHSAVAILSGFRNLVDSSRLNAYWMVS